MSKNKSKILVRWDLQDPNKPRGESLVCDGVITTCKIIFPERRWSGTLVHGSIWECEGVHDTKPNDPDRGAFIVRPVRILTWAWINIGSPLWGVYERDLKCFEYPSLSDYLGPSRHMDYYLQRDEENAAWRQAKEKQDLWKGGLWGHVDKFFAAFGEPTAVKQGSEYQMVLVYPWGEKSVEAKALVGHWACAPTGQLRHRNDAIEVEFRFSAYPDCRLWEAAASLGRPEEGLLPWTLTIFDVLDADTQSQVLGLLRAFTVDPEDMALAYWRRRLARYDLDVMYGELAALHAPEAEIRVSRYSGQDYIPESKDGFRPGIEVTRRFVAYQFHVGGRQFALGKAPEHAAYRVHDVETERCRLIQQRWDQIAEVLGCRLPEWPSHGNKILGLDEHVWSSRYRAAWAVLVDALRREKAALASKLLRALQVEAEWEVFRRASPEIQIAPGATELPSIVVRDIGHQTVYGVAVFETAWSRAHAVWYRDESAAIEAHALASEEFSAHVTASEERAGRFRRTEKLVKREVAP